MRVLLVNGSPHGKGCTYTALSEIAGVLQKNGIGVEFFHIGPGPFYGCTACRVCKKPGEALQTGRCVLEGDCCNALIEKAGEVNGFIFGSPVYYGGINGAFGAVLDRAFFAGSGFFAGKPGAAIVSCRRGGAGSAFDRLNKYLTISQMPVVSSQYWNAVHGNTPEEVRQDKEGLQIMRTLGSNMAWLLKSLEAAQATVPRPAPEPRQSTNFIR
jgi:multimeric flavodoxin WrbA